MTIPPFIEALEFTEDVFEHADGNSKRSGL
jgi:hypothetical protein